MTTEPTVTRKAWLESDQFDLEAVAAHLQSGDHTVVREGNEYYLTSPEIDAAPDDAQANEIAIRIIGPINALGRIHDPNFRPVKLSRYTDDTRRSHVFGAMAATTVTVRIHAAGTVTTPDGTLSPSPPSPWPDYLALAEANSDVSEVLEIIRNGELLNWAELYKVHEIICCSIEPTTSVKLGWTTDNRDSTFTSSANNPAISGSDARHARAPTGNQPKRKMSISEGRQYVRDLVTNWLGHLSQPAVDGRRISAP